MPKKTRVTIEDVARAADVALGTVSRVLNNHTDVNSQIRDRVLKAARSLNYTRLRQRRAMREPAGNSGGAGNIGFIFFGMEDTLAQLPVVGAALQGIEHALASQGRNLMIASIPKGDRVPPFLTEKNVDGLLIKGPNQGQLPEVADCELLAHIYRWPHVWFMGRLPNAAGDHCNFDTDIAGRLAAEHFREKGHRRVGYLNPKPAQSQFERLKQAFSATSHRLGLDFTLLESEVPDKWVWPLPATTVQDKVTSLIDKWEKMPARTRPTALFVPSDRTAVQVYAALERKRLQAGKDLSIISCNNEQSVHMDLRPALSTIDVHAEAIGKRAVDQLLRRMSGPTDSLSVQVLLEPTLVERDSVASL